MNLSDILEVTGDPTRPRWIENPEWPGFAILIRLPDVPGLRGLAQVAVYETSRTAAGADPLEVDPGAVGRKWAHYAVQDWRGLTGAVLRQITAGVSGLAVKIETTADIPFQRELLDVLLRRCPRFYDFLDRAWREAEISLQAELEADEKNSGNAPATTPTPRPDSAAGACKRRKGSE